MTIIGGRLVGECAGSRSEGGRNLGARVLASFELSRNL